MTFGFAQQKKHQHHDATLEANEVYQQNSNAIAQCAVEFHGDGFAVFRFQQYAVSGLFKLELAFAASRFVGAAFEKCDGCLVAIDLQLLRPNRPVRHEPGKGQLAQQHHQNPCQQKLQHVGGGPWHTGRHGRTLENPRRTDEKKVRIASAPLPHYIPRP